MGLPHQDVATDSSRSKFCSGAQVYVVAIRKKAALLHTMDIGKETKQEKRTPN